MPNEPRVGRLVGALMLVQLAGLIAPFIMLHALYEPPGFLESAARSAPRIQLALFLLLVNGALATGIAVYAFPALRRAGDAWATWPIVLGAAWLVMQAVDNTRVVEMVTLSQRFAESSGAPRDVLAAVAPTVAAARRFTHYTTLFAIGSWMLLFYVSLWRARVVPVPLAALGVLAATVHIGGVSLPVLLGYPSTMAVAPGMAISHGALIVWLLTKGFAAPRAQQ